MADPLMDEDYIRTLLSVPVNVGNGDAIQSGAVQALIDLYDRKVTRDEFCLMASSCISLYGSCGKLWMLHTIKDHYDAGELSNEKFAKSNEAFCDLIRKQAQQVIEIVKRLQMCPTSKDPVH